MYIKWETIKNFMMRRYFHLEFLEYDEKLTKSAGIVIIPASAARCISYKVPVENLYGAGSSEKQVHREKKKKKNNNLWLKRQGRMGSV